MEKIARISIHDPELTPREKALLEESRRSWAAREQLEQELLQREAEERKRRRLEAKKRADDFVESHRARSLAQHAENKTPEEIAGGLKNCTLLEKFGIRKEPNGLYRVRPPWIRDIAGLWVKPSVLNSFLVSFFTAGTVEIKVAIASEFYGYLLGFEEPGESFRSLADELGQATKQAKPAVFPTKLITISSAIALVILLVTTGHQKENRSVAEPSRVANTPIAPLAPLPLARAPLAAPPLAPSPVTPAPPPPLAPPLAPLAPLPLAPALTVPHIITPTVPTTSTPTTPIFLKQGDRIWNIAVRLLKKQGRPFKRQDIIALTRQICERNSIRVPELGITDGRYDARHLEVGFPITIP